MLIVEPVPRLYAKHQCLVATGVENIQSEKPFHVLIAKFSSHPVNLLAGQDVANVEDHPETLIESDNSHGELLGIAESGNKYRKSDHSAKDISLINQHLADPREAAQAEQDEHP